MQNMIFFLLIFTILVSCSSTNLTQQNESTIQTEENDATAVENEHSIHITVLASKLSTPSSIQKAVF
jgi:ABC-type Fe3+-citrate transport system substrate-binding protein